MSSFEDLLDEQPIELKSSGNGRKVIHIYKTIKGE